MTTQMKIEFKAEELYKGCWKVDPIGGWLDPCGTIYVRADNANKAICKTHSYLKSEYAAGELKVIKISRKE